MGWGVWFLLIMIIGVDIQILAIAVLAPFLKRKKGDKDEHYSIAGVIFFCALTLYLIVFLILRLMGKMSEL